MLGAEERAKIRVTTTKLVKDWLELRDVISTLPEDEDVEGLRKGKGIIEDGLSSILLLLEGE